MPIHLQTLAVVLVGLMLQVALALLFLALGHPQERGIRHAGFAFLAQAAGVALNLLLQDRLPAVLVIGLGSALVLGGAGYLLMAIREFYGRRVNFWYPMGIGLLVFTAFLGVVALRDSSQARITLTSVLVGLTSLALAREFSRPTRDEVWSGPRWLCAGAFALFGLAALSRAWLIRGEAPTLQPLQAVPANLLLLVTALILYAFMGLGLALVLAQRLEARQQRFAQSDLLTGLLNRRGFEAYADRVLARARQQGQFTALLLLDVDHFKEINDTHGHGGGDLVLESLGDLLHQQLRERDGAGRYGGEELVVLLPETHQSFAQPVAERIRQAIEAMEVQWEGQTIPVTASIGVASTAESDSSLASLLGLADARLYRAKAAGRNRVVVD